MEFGSNPTITGSTISNNDGGFLGGGLDVELESARQLQATLLRITVQCSAEVFTRSQTLQSSL